MIASLVKSKELTGYKSIAAAFAGALLIALCAQIRVQTPWTPVPVTASVFAVVLCAYMLGSRTGSMAIIIYLISGLAGAPVFAGFKSGLAILGPTGGYIVGYIPAVIAINMLMSYTKRKDFSSSVFAGLIGVLIIYISGVAWLGSWLRLTGVNENLAIKSWLLGAAPFIGFDAVKVFIASAICFKKR